LLSSNTSSLGNVMSEWLFNILKSGGLKDNQRYISRNSSFVNVYRSSRIELLCQEGARSVHKNNEQAFSFLNKLPSELEEKINWQSTEVKFIGPNQDYEHNTDSPFFEIRGNAWNDFNLQTTNVIGEIRKHQHCLKISSRFGDSFLKYIIADADGFLEIENFGGLQNEGEVHWLLIYIWKNQLKKAFRLGIPKNYVTSTSVHSKVRGRIDPVHYFINKELGKYKDTYREHSYQTDASILISEVFRLPNVRNLTEDIHSIQRSFLSASQGKRTKIKELRKVKHFTNPYFSEYNKIIDLSKKMLLDGAIGFGDEKSSSAFLFDISMLFEYFIRKKIERSGLTLESKFSDNLKVKTGGGRDRKIQPDIVVETENGKFIFDVKYKNFDYQYGISRNDVFQIHTYTGQYGNDSNILGCGFIQPKHGGENEFIEEEISIMGKRIPFFVCLLAVPEIEEGKEFAFAFHDSCQDFFSKIKKIAFSSS